MKIRRVAELGWVLFVLGLLIAVRTQYFPQMAILAIVLDNAVTLSIAALTGVASGCWWCWADTVDELSKMRLASVGMTFVASGMTIGTTDAPFMFVLLGMSAITTSIGLIFKDK